MGSLHTSTNRLFRRAMVVLATLTMGLGAFAALATPASAMVDDGEAFAMQTVTCNAARHSAVVNFNVKGLPSNVIGGGNGYFAANPYFVDLPVYVQVQYYGYRTGKWSQDPRGFIKVSSGTSTLSYTTGENTVWYFTFWFQNQSGGWDIRKEWGGGGTGYGYYQWGGYNTQPWCAG